VDCSETNNHGEEALTKHFSVTVILLCFACAGNALQVLVPASPPIANSEDSSRFSAVHEDWTTPLLHKGDLLPAAPITGSIDKHPEYTSELVRVQWRAGDPIDLYVIKPEGIKKPPVILYLNGFPTDTDRFEDENFQKLATKGGFAAVGFVSALTGHRYHDRPMQQWFLSELQECLASSAHDVQMILDYLSSRQDLDMTRIGLFAQGSGAAIGILAAVVDPRIVVLDVLDPWGDWPDWFAGSALIPEDERAEMMRPEFLARVAPLDPIRWLSKLGSRPFRFQDAVFEQNTPKASKERLRAAVPVGTTKVIYHSPQEFGDMLSEGKIFDWIKVKLATQRPPHSRDYEN
jgi:hypothetical protein